MNKYLFWVGNSVVLIGNIICVLTVIVASDATIIFACRLVLVFLALKGAVDLHQHIGRWRSGTKQVSEQ